MSDVRLEIAGTKYGGWKEIRIQRGIEQIAGQFELSVTEKWSGSGKAWPIRPGDACRVSVDDEVMITGHVDEVGIDYDSESHEIRVTGRDVTGDLVDCSAPSFQWVGQNLLQGATKLCQPFGITVSADTDIGVAFERLKNDEGETVFETIERAARIRGVLLVSDGQGGLILTRAGSKRTVGSLSLGKNIAAASVQLSNYDRFSGYTIKGQQAGNGWEDKGQSYQVIASVADAGVQRHRPLTVIAEEPLDAAAAKVRGTWERNVRAGRSRQALYTVVGWRDAADALWQPNQLITVSDSLAGIQDELLIVSTAMVLSGEGAMTELTLMPREAFDLVPLPEPKEDGSGW